MDSFNRENSAWCITDGSAGMVSQVKGLALAMKLDYTLKEVKLNFPWNILPVGIVPILSSAFSNLFDFKKTIPPKFIITCGRKSVYLSLFLKRKYKNKVVTIHIQNPKSKFDEFDAIISPKHDKIDLPNSYTTNLAINHISENLIKSEMEKFSDVISFDDRPICLVLLGGQSNNYKFDEVELERLIERIKNIKKNQEIRFFFLFSRRTEKKIIDKINTEFNKSLCDPDNSYSNFNQTSVDINWTNNKENYNLNDNISFDLEISKDGKLIELDSYVGMGGHGVIVGLDSELYMHMHPLGSISMSAQKKFMKSDTDDFICDFGLIQDEYGNFKELDGMGRIVFPSINLKLGNYRFFIQVKVKETQKIVSKQFDFSIS